MNLQCDGRGPDEGFDLQVLFERTKLEFYLPALLVGGGDQGGIESDVVDEKLKLALLLLIPIHNAAKDPIIGVGGVLGEDNPFIAPDSGTGRHRPGFHRDEGGAGLQSSHEADVVGGQLGQPIGVAISTIKHKRSALGQRESVGNGFFPSVITA